MTLGFEMDVPDYRLEVDERAILRAMGEEALAILRPRLPKDSGEFAASVRAWFEGRSLRVGPTGERNKIIARVFRKRGEDLFDLSAGERSRIIAAGQRELDRQVGSGGATLTT